MTQIKRWDIVKIKPSDDVNFDRNRCDPQYFNQEALVLQIFKSGIYLIQLHDGTELRFSKRHLELIKSYDPKEAPFPLFTLEKAS